MTSCLQSIAMPLMSPSGKKLVADPCALTFIIIDPTYVPILCVASWYSTQTPGLCAQFSRQTVSGARVHTARCAVLRCTGPAGGCCLADD